MKKIFLFAMTAVAMLALVSGCYEKKQEQKPVPQFGVVQISKLFQDSRIGRAGIERISELENKAQILLEKSVAAMEKARAENDTDEASRIEGQLKEHVAFMREVIRLDQEHVGNVIQTVMKNVFDRYSREHGLFGIFSAENMVSSSPDVDITAQIMVLLEEIEPAFGNLPSLELPRLPEPANALPLEGKSSSSQESTPEEKK